MHLSTWSCQHICFLYFGCIYWQPEPPTEALRENNHSSHFSVKNEGCFNTNGHSFFSQYFRQGRPLNQVILMVILTEKKQNKKYSTPCQVISHFGWLDPRLLVSVWSIVSRETILLPAVLIPLPEESNPSRPRYLILVLRQLAGFCQGDIHFVLDIFSKYSVVPITRRRLPFIWAYWIACNV